MKNKSFFKIGIIYFVAMCLVATVFVLGSFGIVESELLSSILIQIVVMFAIPFLLYTLFISKNAKQTLKDTGFKKISAKMIGISVLIGLVLYLLNQFVSAIFSSIISIFGYEKISSSQTIKLDYAFLLKDLVLSCIFPGICEEFLHRGILVHANKNTKNPRYILIISSILFGLMHLNINQFFYAAILGYFIGCVALASDSIYPCMIIHFMNNFLGSLILYGPKMNWPICTLASQFLDFIYSTPTTIIISFTLGIPALVYTFMILIKKMLIERSKQDIQNVITELNMENIPIEQAQEKISLINKILQKSLPSTNKQLKQKPSYTDKLFIISSIVLGTLITISSFIWGIL